MGSWSGHFSLLFNKEVLMLSLQCSAAWSNFAALFLQFFHLEEFTPFFLVMGTGSREFRNMSMPQLTTREEVMFFDTDCGGVVHNIAYLRMIETCRTRLAALMGMDLAEMAKTQLFPVVVRTEIDYRIPAKLGDHLEIHGVLAVIERARFWCEFKMVRKGEESPLVTCRQALAMVQMPACRPRRLPQEWKERWQSEVEAD
jgi:YbgC/YbaW family acyl-CoA thioester hydrolase|tara:strand:+ start:197 stop:796 length:600 start_codon:yes stop_codon:yes gene_type:complete